MKIDWTALALVAVVSITTTVLFVVLLSFGIRFVASADVRVHGGRPGSASQALGMRCSAWRPSWSCSVST